MKQPEVQQNWGWLVALYIFLAGLGGGTFLLSFCMLLTDRFTEPARIGLLIGPLLVMAGTFMLVFDLGSPARAYRLFTTTATLLTSWMIRGAWILTAFIILGLAYALPAFGSFAWLPWGQVSVLGQVFGIAAAVLSIFVMLYPGLLLGVIKSIPLWNTSALPLLFLFSGLDTGLAAIVLMSTAMFSSVGLQSFHLLAGLDITMIVLVMVVLAAYLGIVRQTGETAVASVRRLMSPMFIAGVLVAGLLIPLVILIFSFSVDNIQAIRILNIIVGILVLGGGLLLRLYIIKSGVRLPVG